MATRAIPSSQTKPRIDFHITDLPGAVLGFFGLRTESELPFETLLDDGAFSVRNYPAHTEVRNEEVGTRDEASDRSFGRLFQYISGENWDEQRFAMTTPVLQRPRGEHRWSMSFYLKGRVEELPLPKSASVKLYGVSEETMAVLRFSGRPTESNVAKQIARLKSWIAKHDLNAIGEPEIAQFDQPFSIPFLRRNKIHIPIEKL